MPYVPDPTDPLAPLDTEKAKSMAAEFRAMKLFLQNSKWPQNGTKVIPETFGVGSAPSAWKNTAKIADFGNIAAFGTAEGVVIIAYNAYLAADGNWKSKAAGWAILYHISAAGFYMYMSPAALAGADVNIAFTLLSTQDTTRQRLYTPLRLPNGNTDLNHYERRAFVPTLSMPGAVITGYEGGAIRIGNFVQFSARVIWNGGDTSNISIGGLPWNGEGTLQQIVPAMLNFGNTSLVWPGAPLGIIAGGASIQLVAQQTGGGVASIPNVAAGSKSATVTGSYTCA